MYSFFSPEAVGTSAFVAWWITSAPASARAFFAALQPRKGASVSIARVSLNPGANLVFLMRACCLLPA
jgi:hypothetical protein